jgi:amino acid permease
MTAAPLLRDGIDEFTAVGESPSSPGGEIGGEIGGSADLKSPPTPIRKVTQDVTPFRAWLILMNIIIGIGMLSIPYCFRSSGIINDIVILALLGILAFFSFVLLIDASVTANVSMDYAQLMGISFTRKVEWIPNVVIFIIFFGVAVLHLMYTYNLIVACLDEIRVYNDVPEWVYNRWLWVMGLAVLVDLPLTFIKTISKFSRVSIGTCFLILMYLVHAVTYLIDKFVKGEFDPNHEIQFFVFSRHLVVAIAIQAFAFNCHPTVGPTLARLINPTRVRQYWIMGSVVGAAGLAYLAGGLLPYLTLGNQVVEPIVFRCYPTQQVFTIIVKGLYSLFLLITTPLILFSARFCLAGLICNKQVPNWQWVGMGIGMLMGAAIVASAIESLGVMFDFLGGIICSFILYFFPSMFYLRICKGESKVKTVLAWCMFPLGVGTIALSLYDTISNMIGTE